MKLELPFNGSTMPLLDTRNQKIKSSAPGMGYFFWSYWPVWPHRSLHSINFDDTPELDGNTLLPKMLCMSGIEYGELKLILSWKLHHFHNAGGALYTTGGEK